LREQTINVIQELRRRIREGIFSPTETLTAATLALELGVSRSTINKALTQLESEKLISMEKNKRARVRRISLEEILQYYEVREALDCLIIRQSIPFMRTGDFKEIQKGLDEAKKLLDICDFFQCSKYIHCFYDVIYRACPNRIAVEMCETITNQLAQHHLKTLLIHSGGLLSFENHIRILEAMIKGDADLAVKLMHLHKANLRRIIKINHKIFGS
jgi:DNA-binding GntR family transcriptional regulator